MMAPSWLSSSLSWARNCLYSLAATEREEGEALRRLMSKSRHHNKEASPDERRHGIKTHLADGDD
jgi:hypothetical protein